MGGRETKDAKSNGKKEVKKDTGLGLFYKKDDNFGEWYSEVVVSGKMIEYYGVSGLYVLLPSAMSIWELLRLFFTAEIKKRRIEEHYFPLFLTKEVLEKEKAHIDGFSPEVAWVTKCGKSELDVPLAIRPTSEAGVYPHYSKWIRGHRDLLKKIYQWCNVVRWELSNPTPFIRCREFLWQEGHTAFATKAEADSEKGEKAMVWQNSWGYSIRTIGVMIMVHGDDKGLVLPPKVAPLQVIVVPVPYKNVSTERLFDACAATVESLSEAGIRVETDLRDHYSPGWKYNYWELKGVPLRLEIGPKDLEKQQVRAVRRDNSEKVDIEMKNLVKEVREMLDSIQQNLFDTAKVKRDACIQVVKTWDEFIEALDQKKMILAPWCDEKEVEKDVKARTAGETGAAKTLCSPFEQPAKYYNVVFEFLFVIHSLTLYRYSLLCIWKTSNKVDILGPNLLTCRPNVWILFEYRKLFMLKVLFQFSCRGSRLIGRYHFSPNNVVFSY